MATKRVGTRPRTARDPIDGLASNSEGWREEGHSQDFNAIPHIRSVRRCVSFRIVFRSTVVISQLLTIGRPLMKSSRKISGGVSHAPTSWKSSP